MKKALVLFFAVVIGLSFAFTGFAQEKKATPATPATPAKVEAPAPVEKEKPAKKEKKVKKTKKTKKAKGAPAEEKPAETK
jgi:outer membrane biosynthesis protein TonB